MSTYTIDYGTGIKESVIGALEDAKRAADEGAAYTQTNIKILDKNGDVVSIRRWYGVKFDPDVYDDGEDADVICFGDFGHYGEWSEYEN